MKPMKRHTKFMRLSHQSWTSLLLLQFRGCAPQIRLCPAHGTNALPQYSSPHTRLLLQDVTIIFGFMATYGEICTYSVINTPARTMPTGGKGYYGKVSAKFMDHV